VNPTPFHEQPPEYGTAERKGQMQGNSRTISINHTARILIAKSDDHCMELIELALIS
jgi:hypothetical protein